MNIRQIIKFFVPMALFFTACNPAGNKSKGSVKHLESGIEKHSHLFDDEAFIVGDSEDALKSLTLDQIMKVFEQGYPNDTKEAARSAAAFSTFFLKPGDLAHFFVLQNLYTKNPISDQMLKANFESDPDFKKVIEERRDVLKNESGKPVLIDQTYQPKYIDIPALQKLPPETFGKNFSNWSQGLGLSYDNLAGAPQGASKTTFGVPKGDNDWAYFRLHFRRNHDVFHYVSGFRGVTGYDEIGVQAYMQSQLNNPVGMMLSAAIFARSTMISSVSMCQAALAFAEGYHAGMKAKSLFTADWELLWSLPETEVLKKFSIQSVMSSKEACEYCGKRWKTMETGECR